MLDRYKIDMDVTEMVDSFDWYILPVTNPDGYEYTFVDDRVRAFDRNKLQYLTILYKLFLSCFRYIPFSCFSIGHGLLF
jgi:carboxypeptidase A2